MCTFITSDDNSKYSNSLISGQCKQHFVIFTSGIRVLTFAYQIQ